MKKFKNNLPTLDSSLGGGILDKHKPRLEKFIKNKKQKQILIGTIIGIIVLIGGITLYRTFAMYENNKTYNVIQGKVPNFKQSDIQLAIKVDNQSTTVPTKRNYTVEVECDNDATGTWDYKNWAALIKPFKTGTNCTINFTSILDRKIIVQTSSTSSTEASVKVTSYEENNQIATKTISPFTSAVYDDPFGFFSTSYNPGNYLWCLTFKRVATVNDTPYDVGENYCWKFTQNVTLTVSY